MKSYSIDLINNCRGFSTSSLEPARAQTLDTNSTNGEHALFVIQSHTVKTNEGKG